MSVSLALLSMFPCIVAPAFCDGSLTWCRRCFPLACSWPFSRWFLWSRRLWIAHQSADDKGNNVLPCACQRSRRGQILTWEKHLVQGNGGEIGPAHLLGQHKLEEGIEIRSQQSSAANPGKERPELVNIFCLKL